MLLTHGDSSGGPFRSHMCDLVSGQHGVSVQNTSQNRGAVSLNKGSRISLSEKSGTLTGGVMRDLLKTIVLV